MDFDLASFLLGAGSATGVSLAVWRSRARLATIQHSTESQLEGTRQYIGRSADARYARDLIAYFQGHHAAGRLFNLTDLLLEPRLLPAPAPVSVPGSEDAVPGVFDVVPVWHDMPHSYSPYNLETLALEDLGAGDCHIALLGVRGMGKTTALVTLGLMALGEVTFESLEDLSRRTVEEQEKNLTPEERKQREQERERLHARAMARLEEAMERKQGGGPDTAAPDRPSAKRLTQLLPVFFHLADLNLDPAQYGGRGGTADPAEPVVRAVQQRVSSVTSQVVGSVVYPALDAGQALVLIDGYDDLAPSAREAYSLWLARFREVYSQNLIVVAGPPVGYEPLIALGFTPTFMRAWRDDDYALLARRWAAVWTTQTRGRKAAPPDDQAMRRLTADNRGRTALDVTLKLWTGLADDARLTGRTGWYDATVSRLLSHAELREALPAVAAPLIEAGQPLPRERLVTMLREAGVNKPEALLDALLDDGLLVRYGEDALAFFHLTAASYLASEGIAEGESERLVERAMNPAWQEAIGFAAARAGNMLPAVYRRLSAPPDLLYSNLFDLIQWLPDSPPDAPWRGDIFKRLAAALMAPDQYPAVRERAMAALIASRDKNVLFVLRQALRASDKEIRRLACIGLGALGNPEAVKDLAPMLTDADRNVQLAAGLALGAIGTEAALEVMVQGLLDGTEELRRAVAEALAAIPDVGYAILRDGIHAEDIMIRRATVYGLSRVKAPWALTALYRAMLEDEQWYVRAAAEEAFMETQALDREGPRAHPEADSLTWLIQWAAEQGEGVPAGPNARQVLVRVLQEGQPVYKVMAASTLGLLGHFQAIKPLYAALRDRHPEVRSAAYSALAMIEFRTGEPLPGLT